MYLEEKTRIKENLENQLLLIPTSPKIQPKNSLIKDGLEVKDYKLDCHTHDKCSTLNNIKPFGNKLPSLVLTRPTEREEKAP